MVPAEILLAVIDEDTLHERFYERPGKHDAWFITQGLTPPPRVFRPTSLVEIQFYLKQGGFEATVDQIREQLKTLNDPFLARRAMPGPRFAMPTPTPCGGPCPSNQPQPGGCLAAYPMCMVPAMQMPMPPMQMAPMQMSPMYNPGTVITQTPPDKTIPK